MSKNGHETGVAFYIARLARSRDALVLVGEATSSVTALVSGKRHAKPVLPGVNLEKAKGKVCGLRLYAPPLAGKKPAYCKVAPRELADLRELADSLSVVVREIRQIVARIHRT